AAVALARPLVGDLAEEFPLVVLAAALVPVVGDDGYELVAGHADDVLVGERERTARDAVVSDTAERVAVHLPQEDRLALGGGPLPGLPQARQPGDFRPAVLARLRLDERVQRGELVRLDRLGGERQAADHI